MKNENSRYDRYDYKFNVMSAVVWVSAFILNLFFFVSSGFSDYVHLAFIAVAIPCIAYHTYNIKKIIQQ